MNTGVTGRALQEHCTPVTDVYFPNGGVFSVVAADSGSGRLHGVFVETGVSRHHARRAAPDRDARHGHATGRRTDHQ